MNVHSLCVVFALERECSPFRRLFSEQKRCIDAPCRAWRCARDTQSVLIMETGVGAAKTQRALDWLVSSSLMGPGCPVIASGFAGALDKSLRIGDVLIATEIAEADGSTMAATWPRPLTATGEIETKTGRLLCSQRLIGDAAEKKRLGEAHNALAVDMESATVARFCTRQGLPFACVRAISDDVDTSLSPYLASVLAGGQVSAPRLAWALARHPSIIPPLLRLARATSLASNALADFLAKQITANLPTKN